MKVLLISQDADLDKCVQNELTHFPICGSTYSGASVTLLTASAPNSSNSIHCDLILLADYKQQAYLDNLKILYSSTPIIALLPSQNSAKAAELLRAGANEVFCFSAPFEGLLSRALTNWLKLNNSQKSIANDSLLELVLRGSSTGVWDWDIPSGEGEISSTWAEISGYSIEELVPFNLDKLISLVHQDDVNQVRKKIKKHWADQSSIYRAQYRLKHKRGHYFWVEDTGRVVKRDKNSCPLRMVGIHTDISERKAQEENISQLSRIARETTNGVVITNSTGLVEWVNEGFARISGYTLAELKGKTPGNVLGGEDTNPSTVDLMSKAIKEGRGFDVEIINYHKNGLAYWVDINCRPMYAESGALQGFMAIETDVTDKKNAEIKLDRQKQMLEQMSQLGRIGAWEVDLVQNSIYWSSMTKEIHEVPPSYEPELETAIYFYKEGYSRNKITKLVEDCINLGNPFYDELEMVTAKGRSIWIATRGRPEFKNGQCIRLFGSFQDVTEKINAQNEIIKAKEKAEDATKVKSEFLASMSHEIRTPINGIIGMLKLIKKDSIPSEDFRKIDLAKNSANSLLAIINDILDYSKIEAGKLEIEHSPFHLKKLLSEVFHSVSLKAFEKNVDFIIDDSKLIPSWIVGDEHRLRQILNNLCGNAIKFTDHGYIHVMIESTQQADEEPCLKMSVEDTGIGIPEEKLDKLFTSFTQADSSTTRKYGGSGLGLVITKSICEKMNGTISASSISGKGSKFSCQIPFAEALENDTTVETTQLKGWDVHLIFETGGQLESLTNYLQNLGANISIFESIESCVKSRNSKNKKNEVTSLIVVDYQLLKTDLTEENKRQLELISSLEKTYILISSPIFKFDSSDIFDQSWVHGTIPTPTSSYDLNQSVASLFTQHTENPASYPKKPEDTLKLEAESKTVLLVEDNEINLEVATGVLEDLNLSVLTASNGEEAINLLKNHPIEDNIDLIFMDCQMPILDGYQATSHIRSGASGERFKNIPIVAMTANALKGDKEKCLSCGMNDYVSKPIDDAALLSVLNTWLNQSKSDKSTTIHSTNSDHTLWNHSELLRRVNQREDRVRTLITKFLKTSPDMMDQLIDSIQNQNQEDSKKITHALKGVSANLALKRLNYKLASLESSILNEDYSHIQAEAEDAQLLFTDTMKELSQYVNNSSAPQ